MKWINEPIPGCPGYSDWMLALHKEEAVMLRKILQRPLKEYRKRLERLDDIHESGEATDWQENRRCETGDKVLLLELFIKMTYEG